jgi:hypothetical protein
MLLAVTRTMKGPRDPFEQLAPGSVVHGLENFERQKLFWLTDKMHKVYKIGIWENVFPVCLSDTLNVGVLGVLS